MAKTGSPGSHDHRDEESEASEPEALRAINALSSVGEFAELLADHGDCAHLAGTLAAAKSAAGGVFASLAAVSAATGVSTAALAGLVAAVGGSAVVPHERAQFKALMLQNPNYFGNLDASPFEPIKKIVGNTTYEEMTCVGLNVPLDRLEAVIEVKQQSGYGGGICSPGTFEYVRFYVDLHDNGVFHDVGMGSVRVRNIPGAKPLCYAVFEDFESVRRRCSVENLVRVRAILSWDNPPPANTPGFIPVWGNVVNVQVQIRPRFVIDFGDLVNDLTLAEVALPGPIGKLVAELDPATELIPKVPQPLSLVQKKALYKDQVPVHRFAFNEAKALLSGAQLAGADASPLMSLGLEAQELPGLVEALFPADGDTSFEELRCVGLRPFNDTLEAVFTVKKSAGYSGSLCDTGSTEYVAFWINFGDGTGWNYQGTATAQVHDLATIPAKGLQYAVQLKTDLSAYRIACQLGARVVRVRAILSWEDPPPPADPYFVPTWGNREQCRIQLRPGAVSGHTPSIETVGNMRRSRINSTTGLATGLGELALGFSALKSPFGGNLAITGRIGNPPDSFGGGAAQLKYKVEVSPVPVAPAVDDWHPLTNSVNVARTEADGGVPIDCAPFETMCDTLLTADDDLDGLGDGWYRYIEDVIGPKTRALVVDKLAEWQTNSAMEGLWKIKITAKDPSTIPPTVYPGNEVVVRIDNTFPSAGLPAPPDPGAGIKLAITGASFNGVPIIGATECGRFPIGTIITGTYSVHDPGSSAPGQHFGSLSLDVIPDAPANGAFLVPSSRVYPVVPTTGEDGVWSLNTGDMTAPGAPPMLPMEACGYVIRLTGADRTIVSGGHIGQASYADVGFCLVVPPQAPPVPPVG